MSEAKESAKPTPGPWQIRLAGNRAGSLQREITGNHYKDGDGEVMTAVAIVHGNATSQIVTEANARLMAAAPDLLAALRKAVETIRVFHGETAWELYQHSPEMRQINEAIVRTEPG